MEHNEPENGTSESFNFNIFNLRKHSAGCFRETTKDLRKTIRHLEKTTKHLEKIIRQVVVPSPGLFFGKSEQKETEEALYLQEVLGLPMQIYNIFQRKPNRPIFILTFRLPRRPWLRYVVTVSTSSTEIIYNITATEQQGVFPFLSFLQKRTKRASHSHLFLCG